jgi:hypothetical protein
MTSNKKETGRAWWGDLPVCENLDGTCLTQFTTFALQLQNEHEFMGKRRIARMCGQLPAHSPNFCTLIFYEIGKNMNYSLALQKVYELQQKIKDVHPLFDKSYPIAIVEADTFLIFDVEVGGSEYHQVKKADTPMPIPVGVRAAFDLECYENKIACVVTGEVFDTLDGYITIFHEFVHCHQASTCELKLKQTLEVARQAMAAGNYMWEIEHPFPYSNPDFIDAYAALLQAIEANRDEQALSTHRKLGNFLQPLDFEYLIWQEWKEGFARLVENRLQQRFNLIENHYGRQQPYHRITLYEGGAGIISALCQATPELYCDLEQLFWSIQHG